MTKTTYALRHKESGGLLTLHITSNSGGDCCGDVTYELWTGGNAIWRVDDAIHAEYVRNFSTEWYNADYDSPKHDYRPEELEVVEIKEEITPIEVGSLPTFEEYMKERHGKEEQGQVAFIMQRYRECPEDFGSAPYSIYDLKELLRRRNG